MAVVKGRKGQTTIAKKNIPKQDPEWKTDFRDKFYMRGVREISDDALKDLARLMLSWINHSEELYDIRKLLFYQNIIKSNLKDFQNRCPELDQAVNKTYQKIAFNRERNALAKDPAGKAFTHMQGTYDPEWKSQEQYFNQLRENIASKNSTGDLTAVLYSSDDFERINNETSLNETSSNERESKRGGKDTSGQVPAEAVPDSDNKSS